MNNIRFFWQDYFGEDDFFTIEDIIAKTSLAKEEIVSQIEQGLADQSLGMADDRTYYKARLESFGYAGPRIGTGLNYVLKIYNAYVSDELAYNSLGLTTQVPYLYTLAGKMPTEKKEFEFRFYKEPYVMRQSRILPSLEDDWKLLRVLDSLENINSIQDTNEERSLSLLTKIIVDFSQEQKERLVMFSKSYPENVQKRINAIVGEI